MTIIFNKIAWDVLVANPDSTFEALSEEVREHGIVLLAGQYWMLTGALAYAKANDIDLDKIPQIILSTKQRKPNPSVHNTASVGCGSCGGGVVR